MCAFTCDVTRGPTDAGPVGWTRMPPLAKCAATVTTRMIRIEAKAQSATEVRKGSLKT